MKKAKKDYESLQEKWDAEDAKRFQLEGQFKATFEGDGKLFLELEPKQLPEPFFEFSKRGTVQLKNARMVFSADGVKLYFAEIEASQAK